MSQMHDAECQLSKSKKVTTNDHDMQKKMEKTVIKQRIKKKNKDAKA